MKNESYALPPGTSVGQFVIERFLGAGAFGMTYLAWDERLGVRRALKEYLPHDWGARLGDGTVGPRTEAHAEDFRWGRDQFLQEARILAQFDQRHIRHIVRVYDVFEAGGTAYMVTEYVEGRTLEAEVQARGPMSEDRVRSLLMALAEGLSAMHAAGFLHRDIKPTNVMVRWDGSPVLIDFGAARQAIGSRSSELTQFYSPRFAPIEQYRRKSQPGSAPGPDPRQGPWTDIYALGAVAYWALSGREPDEAPARMLGDELPPLRDVAQQRATDELASAVDAALVVLPENRPRSLEEWRRLLDRPPDPSAAPDSKADSDSSARDLPPPPPRPPWLWWWLGVPAAGVVVVALLFVTDVIRNGAVVEDRDPVETADPAGPATGEPPVPPPQPTPGPPPSACGSGAPSARGGGVELVIVACSDGDRLPGVHVLAVFPDGSRRQATSDADGEARIRLQAAETVTTVFAAAPGHASRVERDWRPSDGTLAVDLEVLDDGGSLILLESTGSLPGVQGSINPIRDTYGRTYLYAPNIAVNGGQPQPVDLRLGEDLHLTDADGRELLLRIVDIVERDASGSSTLLEYRSMRPSSDSVPPGEDAVIEARNRGGAMRWADLLLLFPNGTWKQGTTDEHGAARIDLHTHELPMTVFAAASGHAGRVERNWRPAAGELSIRFDPLAEGGSAIFPSGAGTLPGFSGYLDLVRDTLDRTYLYARDSAVNGGQRQPVYFRFGEELRLNDTDGREVLLRVLDIVGESALVEYRSSSP